MRSLFLVLAACALPAALAQNPDCLKQCHQPLAVELKKRFVHPGECGACHVDHRIAPEAKAPYLSSAQPALCVRCHDPASAKLAGPHQQQPVQNAICTTCHDPHASRLRGLLYEIQHGPFAGRHCDECHAEPQNGKVRINGGNIKALCLTCHVIIGDQVAASKSGHAKHVCTECHTPHTSNYRPHLKMPREALCGSCHKEPPAAARFSH